MGRVEPKEKMNDEQYEHVKKLIGLTPDEEAICSSKNLNSICQKFLPKFPYSTLQLQDSSVGPTKLQWDVIFQRLVVQKRGGLCYERDEVLWQFLNKIGYQVFRIEARAVTSRKTEK